jgi:hypothetical protein
MTSGTISLIISIVVALFGAGLLSRFLNINAENAVRADRLQRTEDEVKKHADEIKQNSLNHALLKQAVDAIAARLGKLDLIDGIAADARFTRESIVTINDNLMPRREAENRISNVEHRVDDMERIVERRADIK